MIFITLWCLYIGFCCIVILLVIATATFDTAILLIVIFIKYLRIFWHTAVLRNRRITFCVAKAWVLLNIVTQRTGCHMLVLAATALASCR